MGVLKDPVGIARRGAEYYPLLGRPDHQIECARAASGESGGEMRLTFPVYTYTTDPLCAHAAAARDVKQEGSRSDWRDGKLKDK